MRAIFVATILCGQLLQTTGAAAVVAADIDTDENGTISFEEFLDFMEQYYENVCMQNVSPMRYSRRLTHAFAYMLFILGWYRWRRQNNVCHFPAYLPSCTTRVFIHLIAIDKYVCIDKAWWNQSRASKRFGVDRFRWWREITTHTLQGGMCEQW